VIGVRKEIVIALDWTDFEKDDHTTLCAYLVTRHGRATPLAWKTVKKSALKGTQKDHEYELILRGLPRRPRLLCCLPEIALWVESWTRTAPAASGFLPSLALASQLGPHGAQHA
jgi:hypothetical protein